VIAQLDSDQLFHDRIDLLFPEQVSAAIEMKTVGCEAVAQFSILKEGIA